MGPNGREQVSARPGTLEHMPDPDPITLARLNGTAHRLLREHADAPVAVAELCALTTDPRTLGWAAGVALGSWRRWEAGADGGYDGDRVARMLLAAGGAEAVCEEVAAATFARLGASVGRSGIGHP